MTTRDTVPSGQPLRGPHFAPDAEGLSLECPRPGALIGGVYRVEERIGSGAMGAVLRAKDTVLNRNVAIKFVHPWLLDQHFRERFISEARAMARVSHPNVLQIHAFGEHEGAPYFVMEFVEGSSLEAWLKETETARDLDLALDILDQVCLGVAAIHAAETLHRDLKPSNILLNAGLRARVADLGLAVLCRQDDGATRSEVAGTPDYMAPEAAFSAQVEAALRARADVYSIACMAYELLTGRTPFEADGTVAMMLLHATATPAKPSSLRGGISPALDEAILRALAKDPAERTPSVEAFRRELLAARKGEREPVRILVAEDDDDFREVLELMLSSEFPDAEIECLRNGEEALAGFDRQRPSVAILDLAMPGLDGIQLTAQIRARDPEASIPIIILTASGGSAEWKLLSAIGADRFLVKPIILDDLVALVRRSLHERWSSIRPSQVA